MNATDAFQIVNEDALVDVDAIVNANVTMCLNIASNVAIGSTKLVGTYLTNSCTANLSIFVVDLYFDNSWIIDKLIY